jgi:hypothetical protein
MNTPIDSARCGTLGPWLRIIGVLALALLLQACSMVTLGYNRASGLAYWWLDGLVDLQDAQSAQVRADLDQIHQWHRRQALPRYAELLRQWEAMAPRDITPEQACEQFDQARSLLLDAMPRSVAPLAALAQTLQPEQLAHLKRQYAKDNQKFKDEYISASRQGLDLRVKRMTERMEMFYGKLDNEQRRLLREQMARSSFDAQRVLAERERRQADILATVASVRAAPAQAQALVQAVMARSVESPQADYRTQSRQWIREGCAQFAALHNSTTPAQRDAAALALRGYRDDMLLLSRQD